MAPAKRAKVRVWFLMCLEVVVQRPRVGGCIMSVIFGAEEYGDAHECHGSKAIPDAKDALLG